jgi:hypothetical protein
VLAKTLLEQGRDVATLDIKASSPMLRRLAEVAAFQGNLGNLGSAHRRFERPETIYHLGDAFDALEQN